MYYNSNDDIYGQQMLMSSHMDSNIVKANEQQELANEKRLALVEASYRTNDRTNKLGSFLAEAKNMLVTEAIFKLVKDSVPDTVSESLLAIAKNITSNFVAEEGADSLLSRFKTKTIFLSEMSNIVSDTYSKIVENAKETFADDFTIKNSDLEAFYTRLEQLDYDKMTIAIRDKVGKAEQDFVQANIDDRMTMEKFAEESKEKIDSIKAKGQETEDAMKQEQAQIYKESVNSILDRKKSILEVLVNKTSQSIITNTDMREAYTLESGKLNTSSIIDTAEMMYTFLEAVNTAKIKEITPEYLTSVIDSI